MREKRSDILNGLLVGKPVITDLDLCHSVIYANHFWLGVCLETMIQHYKREDLGAVIYKGRNVAISFA